jgi:hypothetical protein
MALEMIRQKDGVRFHRSDGEVESTVTLFADDDEPTLVTKMRRIIALCEGPLALEFTPDLSGRTYGPGGTSVVGNGWAALAQPPELPDRLKGEVELIGKEEQG